MTASPSSSVPIESPSGWPIEMGTSTRVGSVVAPPPPGEGGSETSRGDARLKRPSDPSAGTADARSS
eukprot:671037-Prymnesium_polylepis.1